MSLRDDILATDDSKVIALQIPEWNRKVHLRVLSGAERDRFEASIAPDPKTGRKAMDNFRGRFAALVLCDEKGERVFTDQDAVHLGRKSAQALDRILAAGMRHNELDAAAVEEAEGKSVGDPSSASGSSSP